MTKQRTFIEAGAGWCYATVPSTGIKFRLKRDRYESTLQMWTGNELLDTWKLTTEELKTLFFLMSKDCDG